MKQFLYRVQCWFDEERFSLSHQDEASQEAVFPVLLGRLRALLIKCAIL